MKIKSKKLWLTKSKDGTFFIYGEKPRRGSDWWRTVGGYCGPLDDLPLELPEELLNQADIMEWKDCLWKIKKSGKITHKPLKGVLELTVADIEEKLGHKVKIVKEKPL